MLDTLTHIDNVTASIKLSKGRKYLKSYKIDWTVANASLHRLGERETAIGKLSIYTTKINGVTVKICGDHILITLAKKYITCQILNITYHSLIHKTIERLIDMGIIKQAFADPKQQAYYIMKTRTTFRIEHALDLAKLETVANRAVINKKGKRYIRDGFTRLEIIRKVTKDSTKTAHLNPFWMDGIVKLHTINIVEKLTNLEIINNFGVAFGKDMSYNRRKLKEAVKTMIETFDLCKIKDNAILQRLHGLEHQNRL